MSVDRQLSDADLDAWLRIRDASFGTHPDPAAVLRETLRSRLPFSYGVDADGALSAVASWYPFAAWIGGVRTETGALAGVVSAPEGRRRGHVRTLLKRGLERLHERGVGFAMEHPFDPRFYAAFGFRTVPAAVRLEADLERVAGDPRRVAFAPATHDAVARLAPIHEAYARRHSFAPDRRWRLTAAADDAGPQWEGVLEPESGWDPPVAYLTDGGYAVLATGRPDGVPTLLVRDAAWVDAAARTRVLDLLGAWRGQARRIRIDLPAHDPLARDEGPSHAVARPALQVRIADLTGALRPLRAPIVPRARTVRIHDAFCPWNDGTWRIAVGPDGTEVAPTRGAAQATLNVAGLASLLAGTPPAALVAAGDADGEVEVLWDLARTTADHPPFLGWADYF